MTDADEQTKTADEPSPEQPEITGESTINEEDNEGEEEMAEEDDMGEEDDAEEDRDELGPGPSKTGKGRGWSGKGGEGEGEYLGEEEEDINDSDEDDEEKRQYKEYLSLLKEIEAQNKQIESLKVQITELCSKRCKTKCDFKEIKRLRGCMQTENRNLHCLVNKAMKLQNFGSKRRYRAIPLATTFDEECLSPYVGSIPPQITSWESATDGESSNEKCCKLKKK